jgi:hypothetical protein
VFVTFTLPSPSKGPLIDGVLHLKWTGPAVVSGTGDRRVEHAPESAGPAESGGTGTDEAGDAEEKLAAAINQIELPRRQEVRKARAIAPIPLGLHPLTGTGVARQIATLPANPIAAQRVGAGGRATRKIARDVAQIRALCGATHNAPSELPSSVCEVNARGQTAPKR